MKFTSFCSSWSLPDNSIIIFWSSMNFLLSELIKGRIQEFLQFLMFHKILLMNFTKILLVVAVILLAEFCDLVRLELRGVSCWRTFSLYSAIIVLRCSSNIVLICALELSRSSAILSWTDPPSLTDHLFGLSDQRKLILSTFQGFECHRKIDHYCFSSQQVSLVLSTTTARYFASWLSSTSGSLGKEAVSSRVCWK